MSSLRVSSSHHQRPSRSCWPGFTGRVHGSQPIEHVLDDMSFLNYRLADVRVSPEVSLATPDIVWHQDAPKGIVYDGRAMAFTGPWPAGPIQKVIVTMLALRMEPLGLHPFHASAVRYRDRTILFLGGESNHGKSMGQIEACRRGALLVSTETTVIDETGQAVMGSREPFLKKRTEGTERADKAAPDRGVEKFFGSLPSWDIHAEPSNVDVVDSGGKYAPTSPLGGGMELLARRPHSCQRLADSGDTIGVETWHGSDWLPG